MNHCPARGNWRRASAALYSALLCFALLVANDEEGESGRRDTRRDVPAGEGFVGRDEAQVRKAGRQLSRQKRGIKRRRRRRRRRKRETGEEMRATDGRTDGWSWSSGSLLSSSSIRASYLALKAGPSFAHVGSLPLPLGRPHHGARFHSHSHPSPAAAAAAAAAVAGGAGLVVVVVVVPLLLLLVPPPLRWAAPCTLRARWVCEWEWGGAPAP